MAKHEHGYGWIKTFLSRIDVKGENECWLWKGCIQKLRGGYGLFSTTAINGKRTVYRAHRLSYLLAVKQPFSNDVLHTCDNPPCVNPSHLYNGTDADNYKDMCNRGRRKVVIPYPWPNSKLTIEQVKEIFLSKETSTYLSHKLRIDRSTVNLIRARKTWTEVTSSL